MNTFTSGFATSRKSLLRTGQPALGRSDLGSGELLSEIGHKFGHEVGNPLTAIISLASILGRTIPADKDSIDALFSGHGAASSATPQTSKPGVPNDVDRLKLVLTRLPDYANSITQEAWRISALTETLVFLLSERSNKLAESELEKSINRALSKLNSRSHIRKQLFDVRVPPGAPLIRIEQDQFVYTLSQLLSNAAEAVTDMEISPEKAITIELAPGFENGTALIVVRNPIARPCPFELTSLFKPFVTEYGARKQLGLGLPTVLSILERHGAAIELAELSDERGQLFFEARLTTQCGQPSDETVLEEHLIRAAAQSSISEATASNSIGAAGATLGANLPHYAVLIVENDNSVATAIERILKASFGTRFSIESRITNGDEALKLLGSGKQLDLILCDLNLNGTSGRTIYETIQRDYPVYAGRFVFLTGERNRKEVIRYLESTRCPYLLKPFDAAELEELVESLLEKKEVDNGPA